jgi:hypothetical protein
MKLFLLRRLNALAMIVEGFSLFFGVRLGLHLWAARKIARENYRRMHARGLVGFYDGQVLVQPAAEASIEMNGGVVGFDAAMAGDPDYESSPL